ncbi:DoxX family protein [Nonomuraea sp. NPDC059023]|uniref:DoxX family protein n=1 Tax=unclassified Nonomuraea TaxID=2593643 RepID=UPI0036B2B246
MFTAYVVVVVVAAACNFAAAAVDFARAKWVLVNMDKYGVPRSWITWLGVAKAAGAVGLLAGLAVPAIGIAAAAGLVLFFAGAVFAVARARVLAHLPFPGTFLVLAAACLALASAAV